MPPPAFGLGIDFGTSNTVAMLRWPDGRVKPLLFEGSPLLPSAVFAPADGGALVVGSDALHHARFSPEGLEPNPKRHIDEVSALLGAREVTVVELVAAVLRHVADEAARVTGGAVASTALSHPAGWGPVRRGVLVEAAVAAGLGRVLLVPEPTAAANYFTAVLHQDLAVGKALVIYDLGAGTFDASVVRRSATGFDVVAVDGLDDVGGLDVDAAIVGWLRDGYGLRQPEVWGRLTNPADADDRRQRRLLWDDVRIAKEMLSRAPAVLLRLALAEVDAQLTRDEFETAAQPLLARTVRTVAGLIRYAELAPADIAGLLLVGGSSRIPLVATLLHRQTGIAPTATEQPELVVAEGTLQSIEQSPVQAAVAAPSPATPVSPAMTAPVSPAMAPPVSSVPVSSVPVSPASGPGGSSTGTIYLRGQVPGVTEIRPSSGPPAPSEESRVIPLWTIPVDGPHPISDGASEGRRSRSMTALVSGLLVVVAVVAITAGIAWRFRPGQNHVAGQSPSPASAGFGADTDASPSLSPSSDPVPTTDATMAATTPASCNPCGTYVYVPDVRRQYKDYAASRLRDAGLQVGSYRYETDPCVTQDNVIRTTPATGARVSQGTTVTLVLADGNPQGRPCDSTSPSWTPSSSPQPSRSAQN